VYRKGTRLQRNDLRDVVIEILSVKHEECGDFYIVKGIDEPEEEAGFILCSDVDK